MQGRCYSVCKHTCNTGTRCKHNNTGYSCVMNMWTHIHTYIHTSIHPSIHTYIHTYIHIMLIVSFSYPQSVWGSLQLAPIIMKSLASFYSKLCSVLTLRQHPNLRGRVVHFSTLYTGMHNYNHCPEGCILIQWE